MGWASGSRTFNQIMDAVIPHVEDKEVRKKIYLPIIEAFEDQDWDTMDECLGNDVAYDEIYAEKYGDWD